MAVSFIESTRSLEALGPGWRYGCNEIKRAQPTQSVARRGDALPRQVRYRFTGYHGGWVFI